MVSIEMVQSSKYCLLLLEQWYNIDIYITNIFEVDLIYVLSVYLA